MRQFRFEDCRPLRIREDVAESGRSKEGEWQGWTEMMSARIEALRPLKDRGMCAEILFC